jgi:RHS repeat-associated protein
MAGISDKAIKPQYAENKYRANGGDELQNKEFSDGSGLEAYDANFRMYDPQIGRFWQQDPLADANESWSPYSYVNDNPSSFVDPLGLTPDSIPSVIVTPGQNSGTHLAKITPTDAPEIKVAPPPAEVPAPINEPVPEPGPNPGVPEVEPIPVFTPAALTVGLVLLPLYEPGINFPNGDEGAIINHKIPAIPGEYQAPQTPFVGNGNRKDNTDPHIVYTFGFAPTDGRTPILKYGISDETRWGTGRPDAQLAALRAKYGPTVMYSIYARTVSRQMALTIEANLVSAHKETWGELPREQLRPNP